MGTALGVEVELSGAPKHEGEHDLGEEFSLEMRLGLDRLAQPRFDLVPAHLRDRVALAFGPGPGLHLTWEDLSVARQATERRVDLAERERLAAPEVAVVIAL